MPVVPPVMPSVLSAKGRRRHRHGAYRKDEDKRHQDSAHCRPRILDPPVRASHDASYSGSTFCQNVLLQFSQNILFLRFYGVFSSLPLYEKQILADLDVMKLYFPSGSVRKEKPFPHFTSLIMYIFTYIYSCLFHETFDNSREYFPIAR